MMMRQRSLGNSPTAMLKKLEEMHDTTWLRRLVQYLTAFEAYRLFFGDNAVPTLPPTVHPLPNPRWLMVVYERDVRQRADEVLRSITSVTGTILKMDSTKKVLLIPDCIWPNILS